MAEPRRPGIWIVFDGAPGPRSGTFVETEDELGRSVGGYEWRREARGFWALGPFDKPAGTPPDRTPGGPCPCGHPNRIHGVLTDLPWCCYVDDDGHCASSAEYHIETRRADGGIAGPDLYGDDTHACSAHIGSLLGWQPDAKDTDEIVWTVSRL